MSTSLRGRASKAATWSFVEVFGRTGIQFALSLILSRMITPSEYGGYAIIALLITVCGYAIDAGLAQALIRKRDINAADWSTAFWFNLLIASVVALIVVVASASMLRFFRQEELADYLKLASLSLPLLAIQSIHRAYLTRDLRFRALGAIALVSAIVSGLFAVMMAAGGYGLSALVWQMVLFNLISGILTVYAARELKLRVFRLSVLVHLWRFGVWVALGGILNALRGGVLTTLVARGFGTTELGLFNRAEGLKNLSQSLVVSSVERVLLPAMSEAAHQKERLRRAAVGISEPFMLLSTWIMLSLASTSDLSIAILYGETWVGAADYLPYLCIAGALLPMSIVNVQLMLALGESRRFFWLDFVKATVAILLSILAVRHGVAALALAQIPIAVFSWAINSGTAAREIGFGFWRQIVTVGPILVAGAIATALTLAIRETTNGPILLELILAISVWSLIYIGVLLFLGHGLVRRSYESLRSITISSRT